MNAIRPAAAVQFRSLSIVRIYAGLLRTRERDTPAPRPGKGRPASVPPSARSWLGRGSVAAQRQRHDLVGAVDDRRVADIAIAIPAEPRRTLEQVDPPGRRPAVGQRLDPAPTGRAVRVVQAQDGAAPLVRRLERRKA